MKSKSTIPKYDAYATVISGAGVILTLSRKESGELVRTLKSEITTCDSEHATINNVGVIEEVVYPS